MPTEIPENFWDLKYSDQLRQTEMRLRELSDPIPMFTGRPEREKIIQPDDILNFKIALGTARTIEEFVSLV